MGHVCSLGCIENPRSSVIGLFRRESTSSTHMSSCESSPGRGTEEGRPSNQSQQTQSQHYGPSAVLVIEESSADPLGVLQAPPTNPTQPAHHSSATIPRTTTARRGSMLEFSTGSVSNENDQSAAHNSI